MLAYILQFFSSVYFSPVGLFIVSYVCSLFCFRCFFCNKFEIWWLYQSSTVHVEDIVDALRTVDSTVSTYPDKLQMPIIFVARSMFNLPTISQSQSTVTTNHNCALENRVHILESQMVEIIKTVMPSTRSTNRNDQVGAINKVPTDSDQDATSGSGNGNRLTAIIF